MTVVAARPPCLSLLQIIALTQNAVSIQANLDQQMAQQARSAARVKDEPAASSQPAEQMAAAAGDAAAGAAACADSQGQAVAATVLPAAVPASPGPAAAAASSKAPSDKLRRAAEKLRAPLQKGSRSSQQDLHALAVHQSAAAAGGADASAAGQTAQAAAGRSGSQAGGSNSSGAGQADAAAIISRGAARLRQLAAASNVDDSTEAAEAAALALTELAGSPPEDVLANLQPDQQQQAGGMEGVAVAAPQQKRRVGSSRLQASSRAAHASPSKAR